MEDFTDIYGILYGCPVQERFIDCPILKVEELSFKDKILWFEQLNCIEKSTIQKHHMECSNNRKKKLQ